MKKFMRQSTLQTLGLGSAHDFFEHGRPPFSTKDLVEQVFGKGAECGSMVISGANGIVGAGKAMQLASRLQPFGVNIIALDLPGAPDGIGMQYKGLAESFGQKHATEIMEHIVRMSYDGKRLPSHLTKYKPKFLLEAIPEILDLKKAHYKVFREQFPDIEIRSVTSGFPSSELGVGIAHPAFPHQINKVWEIIEPKPSPITQLLWSLGMIPVPMSDHWSFVLDVLFCGITLAALRYHRSSNMPYWKVDKFVRSLVGPNPFRAHDTIGAKGANFLTWSCLHHLSKEYGDLFEPTPELIERKETGESWYPPNHLRPLVNWSLDADEEKDFRLKIMAPLFQMTSLLLQEKRAHLSYINAVPELCAQFYRGPLALIRGLGTEKVQNMVAQYHKLYPEFSKNWHPKTVGSLETHDWQQLYVNAEHDGKVGVITIGRESYNDDVDEELNRAIDWSRKENIKRIIICGDFHLSTQLVGADISEFYPALGDPKVGEKISAKWSKTARRLHDEFEVSVGFISGKRCLGGCLELLLHCHYLVSVDGSSVGFPEVTLPVVPGMEGCHWAFRKTESDRWPQLMRCLLTGQAVPAKDAVGWLVDYSGSLEESLQMAWKIVAEGKHGLVRRLVKDKALKGISQSVGNLPAAQTALIEAGRKAILDCIVDSCGKPLSEALQIQARHSADFMSGPHCRKGKIGADFEKAKVV